MESEWKTYRRTQIAEMRDVTEAEIKSRVLAPNISVSNVDRHAGSPKEGDMIARNPKNHEDQWLVSAQYYADNFEPWLP